MRSERGRGVAAVVATAEAVAEAAMVVFPSL
jgi:hypothetical protein